MGSHVWAEQCPYCGFEGMTVSSCYDSSYFEIACQICGYAKWTEEGVPDSRDVELAKQALSKMDYKEKEKAFALYDEDNIPLVIRLQRGSDDQTS